LYRGKKLMETLLRRSEDPNYKNALSCTPLHYCCSHDFPRGVALLLSYDADVEAHDEEGEWYQHSSACHA
jgi:ankyrin repeat protein